MPAIGLPNWDEEGDLLAGLSEEDKRRFLESFGPAPTAVGGAPRGFEALAPSAPRSPPATVEGTATTNESDEDALMRRFVEAQQQGNMRDSINRWASGTGQDIANFVNAGGYGRINYVNSIARDEGLRTQPVRDLQAQENAKAEMAARKTKAATEARDAEADAARVEKVKTDTANAQAEAAREAALSKLDSAETRAMRDFARAHLKARGPETLAALDGMNGIQIRDALRSGTSAMNADTMAGLQQQRLDMTEAQQEFQRQMERWRAGLEQDRLDQQWDLAQLTLSQQRELEALRAEREAAKATRERGDKLAEREVGGFEFADPESPPSTDAAKKMADAAISRDKIQRSIRNLKALVAKYGTELYGDEAGLMESYFMDITNGLRTFNDMGVPNGRDYEMLAKELPDPTAWRDYLTSTDRNLAKIDALSKRLDEKVGDTAYRLKYKPVAPRAAQSGGAPSPAPRPKPPAPSGQSAGAIREVDVKGMKPGDLKASMKEGETVRLKRTGKMFRKQGGKLIPVTE